MCLVFPPGVRGEAVKRVDFMDYREFGRWLADMVEKVGRVVAPEDERTRYEFGSFVPVSEDAGVRVPLSEFKRSPGKFVDAVIRSSGLDSPVVYAEAHAGMVSVMAGKHRMARDDLGGYLIG